MMKKTIPLLWLFLFIATSTAQEFEPPVIIDPPSPKVGDTIRIGLYTEFFPPCLLLPEKNLQGETHLFESNDNHYDLTVVTNFVPICNPLPIFAPREFYELGQLEEGDYSIQTFWVDPFTPLPVPGNLSSTPYGRLINFSVTKPIVIDSTSQYGLVLLIILILIFTLYSLRKGNDVFVN